MKHDTQTLAGVAKDFLRTHNIKIEHRVALELIARLKGFRDLHEAQKQKDVETPKDPVWLITHETRQKIRNWLCTHPTPPSCAQVIQALNIDYKPDDADESLSIEPAGEIEPLPTATWVIQGPRIENGPADGKETLYWSESHGWGDLDGATRFDSPEGRLPLESVGWVNTAAPKTPIPDSLSVTAEIHTDDRRVELTAFDVTTWFQTATNNALRQLIQDCFEGAQSSDRIAEDLSKNSKEIFQMFEWIHAYNRTRASFMDPIGFEVSVDPKEACASIRKHRPELLPEVLNYEKNYH